MSKSPHDVTFTRIRISLIFFFPYFCARRSAFKYRYERKYHIFVHTYLLLLLLLEVMMM